MLIQITTDEKLRKLLRETGFLLNVDYPTRDVKVHRTSCSYADPDNPVGVKPSSKTLNKTGEFWYSENRKEILQKAEELANIRKFNMTFCAICNP
jgi:hypothetical protein